MMPRYEFRCANGHDREIDLPVGERDSLQTCDQCILVTRRRFSVPHNAPIGGIPNKLNRNWREPDPEPWEHLPQYQTGEQKRASVDKGFKALPGAKA